MFTVCNFGWSFSVTCITFTNGNTQCSNNKKTNYTKRQKKLFTSSERHSLKFKASKWIIFGHTLAIVLLTKHISKGKCLVESKRSKMGWNRMRLLLKNHRSCSSPRHEARTDKSKYGGYITCHWNWMNSYWMFWIGGLSWRFSASSFCDFWKLTFCDLIAFFSFFGKIKPLIFQMCFIRRTIAYRCLNMNNSDTVDFSERRSEEAISFFWRSVYNVRTMDNNNNELQSIIMIIFQFLFKKVNCTQWQHRLWHSLVHHNITDSAKLFQF